MNKFNEIEDKSLRAYNRCVQAYNLKEDAGEAKAHTYLESFDNQEKAEMLAMMAFIQARGVEEVKRMVMKEQGVVNV